MAERSAEGAGTPPFGANPRKTGNDPSAQHESRESYALQNADRADVFTLGRTTYNFDSQQLTDTLPVACELHTAGYISAISAELREFYRLNSRTITQAPTGAGKTVALVRDILPHFAEADRAAVSTKSTNQPASRRGLSVLFVPTVALAKQLRYDKTCGRPPVMVGRTDRYDLQDALQTGYCIATYDQADKLFPYISRCWVDEAHYLVSASGYRHKAVSALQRLIYEGVDVHLVSATPPPLYTQEDFKLCKITTDVDNKGEKPAIQLQTMQSVTQYRQYALAYLAERVTLSDNALTVVLLNSTKSLAMLRDYLLELGVLPNSIALLTRDTKSDSPIFQCLQESAPVPENVRFILATSVLECGVSLYAPGRTVELTHIENQPVQPTPERLLQFFARVRISDTQHPESLTFRAFTPSTADYLGAAEQNAPPQLSELVGDYHLEKQFWSAQAILIDNYAAQHTRGSESVYVSEAYTPTARYLLDLRPQHPQPKHVPNQAAIMHQVTRGWHDRFTPETLKAHLESVWAQPTDLTAAEVPDSSRQAAEKQLKDAHRAALKSAGEALAGLIYNALTNGQTAIEDVLNLPRAAEQLGWCSVNQYYASSLELDHPGPQAMQLVQQFKRVPDLLEWFAQTCYALVRAKVAPTQALQLLLKSRRELHSKAEMARRVQTFELQRLMFTPDHRLTTTSQNDKARLEKRLMHISIDRTYTATQIQAMVNREVGNRAKRLGKINAIRLVASLFIVEEHRSNSGKTYTITARRSTEQTLAELCYPIQVTQGEQSTSVNTGSKFFEGERFPEKPMLTTRGRPPGEPSYRLTFRDGPPDDPPDNSASDPPDDWQDDPPF